MKKSGTVNKVIDTGLSMGSALAMIISWDVNQSVLLALLHGVLSWLYVLYHILDNADKCVGC